MVVKAHPGGSFRLGSEWRLQDTRDERAAERPPSPRRLYERRWPARKAKVVGLDPPNVGGSVPISRTNPCVCAF